MHPQQLKKKPRGLSPRAHRTAGDPKSYLKIRTRGSRLLNAARFLVLVKLSRRLHQAYAQAYDKQAADKLLPQNTGLLIGRFGFNANETERLGHAYDKITADKCRSSLMTLWHRYEKGEIHSGFQTTPTTLAQTLSITKINKYSST